MAALDMTAYAAALKHMYPQKQIENMTFKKNAAYAMLRKDTEVGGTDWTIPIHYEDIAGSSSTFSVAQANKAGSKKVAFAMTAADDYSLASIKGKVWRASQGDTKAFLAANKSELDSAFNAQRRRLGIKLYRDGSGSLGTATFSTTTFTMAVKSNINNLGKGQKIQLATSATAAPHAGTLTINTISRMAGTFTVTVDPATAVPAASGTVHIFIEGDAYGINTSYLGMRGFDAWFPQSAPSSAAFFGVDRSVDDVRLGGVRIDATGLTIEEALIEAQSNCSEQGGSPDVVFVPALIWKTLLLELGAKKEYVETKIAGINFRGVVLYGDEGDIAVYTDRNCPGGTAYMLTKSSCCIYSIGPMPGILDLDNVGSFLRESTDDAYELRVGGYPQFGCNAPGYNAVIYNLPTS